LILVAHRGMTATLRTFALVLCGALLGCTPVQAHLIAAQKGTLNFVGQNAFLVLSVPVAALQGVDDDRDSRLSKAELTAHFEAIGAQIKSGVQLMGSGGPLPLQVVMLDIASPDTAPGQAATHLVVLGRFELAQNGAAPDVPVAVLSNDLRLRFSLFGTSTEEQAQDLTITRDKETQWMRLSPSGSEKSVLPGRGIVFLQYLRTGALHVLSGADHMLFLLVVLSSGWGVVALLGALTCFTAGHALTLVACVLGGVSVADRIVEPAIAATIIGMACFDLWSRRRLHVVPAAWRLVLVFGCSLVHGMGLAGALQGLTQWPSGSAPFALALAGFNVGIELAQICVALLVLAAARLFRLHPGTQAWQQTTYYGSWASIAAGSLWLVERLVPAV
jgi:hypothetical protein